MTEDRRPNTEDKTKRIAIKNVKDLKVYRLAHKLAMEIFEITKTFPKEETYSLTDQMRRSSRSVSINIREGYAKRRYEQVFIRHLNDSLGSSEETRGWLDFAADLQIHHEGQAQEVGRWIRRSQCHALPSDEQLADFLWHLTSVFV